jgi:hypothetical protein
MKKKFYRCAAARPSVRHRRLLRTRKKREEKKKQKGGINEVSAGERIARRQLLLDRRRG